MSIPEPGAAAPRGVRRRDLLAGGLGAVAGLAAGAAVGRTLLAPPPSDEPKVPKGARVSYAQYGEDLVAASLFESINVEQPTYLDIGAADPVHANNTYLFYLAGGRGVLVEPNVAYTESLKSVRPGDTVVVAGIGVTDQPEADYFVMDSAGLNTFDREQAERLARDTPHKIQRVIKMPLLGINRVIAEHFGGKAPDFISIDIEGLDYAVLKTLDFAKYRPKLVCAETLITSTARHKREITDLMIANGYEVRGMTFPNTFYLDKNLIRA